MPVTIKEDWEEGDTTLGAGGASIPFHFNIFGATSRDEAWQSLAAYAPLTYAGLIRSEITVNRTGPTHFKGKVTYASAGQAGTETPAGATPPGAVGAPAAPAPATTTEALGAGYEFSFVGEMKHKTLSLKNRYRRKRGDPLDLDDTGLIDETGTAADYRRAVGVSRSAGAVRLDGYDAPEVAETWSRTVTIPGMTLAYKNTLRSLVGTKNDDTFYGSLAGEVLLWGVSGRHLEDQKYSLTFTFHERPNLVDYVVSPDPDDAGDPPDPTLPGALVVPFAAGWDHVWVEYQEGTDDDNTKVILTPVSVYVEEVVPDGDFTLLGLGS